ncbi:MAG: beta-propeller domain-containing protein [Candidatus Peregrinibacteria bacterium]|nr:beta-propeller domain-containing protein [Candidatus Peregrinibacteria bacterium]MDZ4245353.1 beta-propeller domain-containing protein [Candidatus Gracilibacteria bacterium]
MKKMLKWLSIPFIILLISTQVVYADQTPASGDKLFMDVSSNDPSKDGITYLKEHGVLHGYSDGTFKSTSKINRAEFIKIVIASLDGFNPGQENGKNCFSDVKDEWFAEYVCYAKENGIISGYSDGTFRPANNINFAEASKIMVNAFDMDVANVSGSDPWYRAFVEPLAANNAIPESISDFDKFIARGEMAEVVYRIKDEVKEKNSLDYFDLEAIPVSGQSCAALGKLFEGSKNAYYYGDVAEEAVMDFSDDSSVTAAPQAVSNRQESGSSDEYSETNVQVQGVDEADIVKNDGEYIYMVSQKDIRIVKAYPADQMSEISKVTLDNENFNPSEIYVDGDTLVVIGSEWSYRAYDGGPARLMWYPEFHSNRTIVLIYNISDRTNPRITRKLTFDGSASHSRRVDDTMYLVLNKSIYAYYNMPETVEAEGLLPRFSDSKEAGTEKFLTECEDIMYFPRTQDLNYVMAVAIPLKSNQEITTEVMLGNSENIYASQDNLYIASTNYNSGSYYYDWSNAKTMVYKYALAPNNIEYKSRGKVPGTILNQFSMDESKGFFRIATTKGDMWGEGGNISKNNLYVLNADMNIVGDIEDIAPGEKIYSTRFMGDRGYMVTFKNVDPLFAFDLSDPYNPKILGKLKIPGYSDYLHPYDENHIIGFGKDAVEVTGEDKLRRGDNFAWYQGMKIALFDVTDPANPTQMFTELIGDRGTQSDVLYDHKALLFDKEKNLLAFPVQVAEVPGGQTSANPDAYGTTVFDGAYVYSLDLENGFKLRGKISHYSDDDEAYLKQGSYWYGDALKDIKRILYIGANLYTVADGGIKASDINTIIEKNYLELTPSFEYDDQIYNEDGVEPVTPGGVIRNLFR